jgi:hypothetical protein
MGRCGPRAGPGRPALLALPGLFNMTLGKILSMDLYQPHPLGHQVEYYYSMLSVLFLKNKSLNG